MKESCVSRMQMSDIRRNIVGLWSDTAASWQDDMSKKYRIDRSDGGTIRFHAKLVRSAGVCK